MGGPSITRIKNKDNHTIVTIYRQFDGYLEGHGKELAEEFGNTTLLSGFGNHGAPRYANGMGCLAAQIVAYLKDGIGGIYLDPDPEDQEGFYVYTLTQRGDKVYLEAKDPRGLELYRGYLSDLLGWLEEGKV